MRLFLNYGHGEHTAVTLRLKSDLERRGHQVWFDQDHLKHAGAQRRSAGRSASPRTLATLP
jgi:hypothetical protein